jgi:HEAT repeat protein
MNVPRIAAVVALLGSLGVCSAAEEPLHAGKPLGFWLHDLKSDDPLICEEAILVLTEVGPAARAAVPRLETLTKDKHRVLRFRAGLALWQIAGQKKPAIAALTEAVRDPATPDRIVLLRTLTDFGPDAATSAPTILDLVGDSDPVLASQSVQMLPKLGPGVIPLLATELEHKDVRRRRQAGEALAQFGASASEAGAALRRGLEGDDKLVRAACARALWAQGQTTDAVVAVLDEASRSDDSIQRRWILDTVGSVHLCRESAPVLKAFMRGSDRYCRLHAAQKLPEAEPQPALVLPIFVEALKSGEPGPRAEAARGLAGLGAAARPALPALMEVYRSPDGPFLRDIPDALVAIGAPAVPPLMELLIHYKDDSQRATRLMILVSRIGTPAVPGTLPLLDHTGAAARVAGCRTLGLLGPAAREAVPRLAELLADADARVRREAVSTLGRIGPAARPATKALLKLADGPQLDLCLYSLKALEQIQADPDRVRPFAVRILRGPQPFLRVRAVSLLWHVAPKEMDLMPHVLELLNQPIGRLELFDVVGQMGPHAAGAVPALTKLLSNRDFSLRIQLVQALGQIGPVARPAVPTLADLLATAEVGLRTPILTALLSIGGDDREQVVPAVLAMAKRDATYTRTLCLRVLARYGRKSAQAVPWLVDELHRPPSENTVNVANALLAIDGERARKEALPVLREMLKGAGPLRLPAAGALLRLQPDREDTLRLVVEGLQAKDLYTRQRAAQLLAAAGPAARPAAPALRHALRDSEVLVRIYAADALYQAAGETKTTLPILLEALKPSVTTFARHQAVEKLGDMGRDARAALPILRQLRHEHDPFVRNAAVRALWRIDPAEPTKP